MCVHNKSLVPSRLMFPEIQPPLDKQDDFVSQTLLRGFPLTEVYLIATAYFSEV